MTDDTACATQAGRPLRRAPYGQFDVGSFLDSEGNKLWFCSAV